MPVLGIDAGPRQWFGAMALACFASVGAALVAQHGFDMRPCPWCILQRVLFVAVGLLALGGVFARARPVQVSIAAACLLLAAAAIGAALHQHFVAAKSSSCNLTLADRIVSSMHLDTAMPAIFGVTASCADAAVDVFGIPFEFWSVALSALIVTASLQVLWRR